MTRIEAFIVGMILGIVFATTLIATVRIPGVTF